MLVTGNIWRDTYRRFVLWDGRNLASRRTAEKAGLTHEGVLRQHLLLADGSRRDTYLYAMLKADWLAQRSA